MPAICRCLLVLALLLAAPFTWSADEESFLPVHEAFKVSARVDGNLIHYTWTIAPGYYLYQHRFAFEPSETSSGQLDEPRFEQVGVWKDDPIFGRVVVFYDRVDVRVPVQQVPADGFIEVDARYQGCADEGLCYIPQTYTDMFQVSAQAISAAADNRMPGPSVDERGRPALAEPPAPQLDRNDALNLEGFLLRSSFLTIIGVFFLIGIGLTFTPCVLPMIPILSSIIVGQGQGLSRSRAALLSLVYVLGMAVTYAILGVIAGLSGHNLTVAMQNPVVLFSFAGLFVLLSLSMFGFYELQLPAFLRDRLHDLSQRQRGGTYAGVAVIGALSALIVSPCVSAPLAGALLYIGKTGDWQLGGASLLALGLGMGAPLLAVGITGANILPRAGVWMDNVKALFGVILLAVALWLVKHLLPDTVRMLGWALLAILTGLYLGALDPATGPRARLFKGLGILALVGGAALAFNTLAPRSAGVASTPTPALFQVVRSQAELDDALATAARRNQPVLLDFYADWCTACLEMEHENFSQPPVQALLRQHHWLQIDLTNNPEDQALLSRFGIPGPPALLFFGPDGEEIRAARLYAFKPRDQFIAHLQRHGLAAN